VFDERPKWLRHEIDAFKDRVTDMLPHIDKPGFDRVLEVVYRYCIEEHVRDKKNEEAKIRMLNQ